MMWTLAATLMLASPPPTITTDVPCRDSLDVAIFVTPQYPNRRVPLRIHVVSERPLPNATLGALAPDGTLVSLEVERFGGPPWGWVAKVDNPARGRWRIAIGDGDELHACQRVRVRSHGGAAPSLEKDVDPVWTPRIKWERDTENLFSLWVEHLFDTPPEEEPSWRPLHSILRNEERNFLYNHLNLGEDGPEARRALRMRPDCADFPYHLRAYFAWKLGLPFAYRPCRRGRATRPPRCGDFRSNLQPAKTDGRRSSFQIFADRDIRGTVHSSSPRTLPADNDTDFYPVALTRNSVRPGAIFADPYGHILVVAKWVPQTADRPGILFAVDAQPDKTIGRRRFWRGSFLFPEDGAVTGAGFKRFRPIYKRRDGTLHARTNAEIARSRDYGDYSLEQWERGKEAFYEAMDALINPAPMKPETAFRSALDALTEQVRRRVLSVNAGEDWVRQHPGRLIEMPEGARIFQTAGPWEEYSTPSRDLRLLIAMQTVIDYPSRVVRHPERFVLAPGLQPDEAQASLEENLLSEARKRRFSYHRSNGQEQELSIADVLERRLAMEMAYHPMDCPEIRWGAPTSSEEYSACQRHASEEDRERMGLYRTWFHERRRPLR